MKKEKKEKKKNKSLTENKIPEAKLLYEKRMNTLSRISYIVVVAFILILLVGIFLQRTANVKISAKGIRLISLDANDANAYYSVNEVVLLEEEPENIEIGDIVAYDASEEGIDGVLTAKITDIESTEVISGNKKSTVAYQYIFQVDENTKVEIRSDKIIGKVVYHSPLLSFISKMASGYKAIILIAIAGVLILMTKTFNNISSTLKGENEDEEDDEIVEEDDEKDKYEDIKIIKKFE